MLLTGATFDVASVSSLSATKIALFFLSSLFVKRSLLNKKEDTLYTLTRVVCQRKAKFSLISHIVFLKITPALSGTQAVLNRPFRAPDIEVMNGRVRKNLINDLLLWWCRLLESGSENFTNRMGGRYPEEGPN